MTHTHQATRTIGTFTTAPIGLGCMNLSHAYGTPPDVETAERFLLTAVDAGVTLFDTAALYGFGANETLVGRVLKPHRNQIVLTSKCGMQGVNGMRVIDGRPDTLRQTCDDSLRRLQTESIDVYYLHRLDPDVPIEESVGALADLQRAGKIRGIGLSEVSATNLRRAHREAPIAALQSEYSLWTRNPEIATLDVCRELGVSFVAFSPLGRGFLADALPNVAALDELAERDLRRNMPRFAPEAFAHNLSLLMALRKLASAWHCTPAQLSLAWLLHTAPHIIPIPGTTSLAHLQDNHNACAIELTAAQMQQLNDLASTHTIIGGRYNATTQAEIDTEEF